ncbi:MAG: helix-turn-helix domain-containing protein [Erythrobacter sp.]|nr:helix-turn-helix domain-containing protein [Erythrobacter sp.]
MNEGPHITSQTGATRSGSPLALSRAPSADLRPWFYWYTVAEAEIAQGVRVDCGRFVEHPSITFLFHDPWTATTADGVKLLDPGQDGKAFYFGPHTRQMPLSISGRYIVVSLLFNAGAAQLLGFPDPAETLDRVIDLDDYFARDEPICKLVPWHEGYESWAQAIEDRFMRPLAQNATEPQAILADFQNVCLAHPETTVEEFASRQGMSRRTVERVIKKALGITPKQALRQARALDMGAALLGVARNEDLPEIEDRYFDQSHRIKEVRALFGKSPGELRSGLHPILRLSLEVRQKMRLEALNRLKPDELGPWRDPASEPRANGSA